MIVLHTDASTKEGYSCWAYHRSDTDCLKYGIKKTMNSTGAEILAAVMGITQIKKEKDIFEKLLIITDSLLVTQIIQQGRNYIYSKSSYSFFNEVREKLLKLVDEYDIDALWINSLNKNKTHILVDAIARNELNNYLNNKRIK